MKDTSEGMWQHACDLHGLSCFAPKSRNTQDTCEITLHRVCLSNSYDVFWIYFHMQKCGCGPSEDGSPRRGCLLHGRYERLRKLDKWTVWTNKHIRRNLLFLPRSGSEPWTSGNSDIAMTTTPSAHSFGSICKSAYVSHAFTLAITLSAFKRCTSVQCEYLLGSGISPIKRKSCVLFIGSVLRLRRNTHCLCFNWLRASWERVNCSWHHHYADACLTWQTGSSTLACFHLIGSSVADCQALTWPCVYICTCEMDNSEF